MRNSEKIGNFKDKNIDFETNKSNIENMKY